MTALPSSELIELGKEAVDWALHVGRVGLWALVAMWCGLTTVRLAALFVLRLQRRAPAVGPPRPLLVAVTGYGRDEDQQRSLQVGIDVHLTKPVDPMVLQRYLVNDE